MTDTITIPCAELPARVAAIEAKGGVVTRMSVDRNAYTLTVKWDEQPELPQCACAICRSEGLHAAVLRTDGQAPKKADNF